MNTTSAVVATGVIVTIGQWSDDKHLSVRVVVGAGALALALAAMPDVLAERFAALFLVVAAFLYIPSIAYKAGLTKVKPPKWEWSR